MATRRVQRRLTAILAADMVGYSRMMGEDEAGTLDALRRIQSEIAEPRIGRFYGRIVKLTGDGILAEFPSVVEATKCAIDLQRALAAWNDARTGQPSIRFRIGINLGDVLVEGDDIFGDGVNVASRLEAEAEPGGICLSGAAYEQVRGKLRLDAEDLGELRLKNIAEPVRAWRIARVGQGQGAGRRRPARRSRLWWAGGALAALLTMTMILVFSLRREELPAPEAGRSSTPAIAVLPFDNLSEDPAQEYFSDGITEDLITDLSRVSGLLVIARNSTFVYKDRPVRIEEVGRDLGVDYVVEGSVRKVGERVRINAQLIDASTGHHLWAERFDRQITDVFALQDDVVRRIVSSLAVQLTGEEQRELATVEDVDPQAYDTFLRGLEVFRRFTRETNAQAREHFSRAAAIDPTFARAHADVALSLAMDLAFEWTEEHETTARRAMKSAAAALALDDRVPQVHFAEANVLLFQKRHEEAAAAALQAIEIDPNYADAHGVLAMIRNFAGEPEMGLESIRRAMRLNPFHPFFYVYIEGQSLFQLKRYEEAVERLARVTESNPAFPVGHQFLAAAYLRSGDKAAAEWEVQEILTLQPTLTLGALRERSAYRDPDDLDRFIDALRRAGLPE